MEFINQNFNHGMDEVVEKPDVENTVSQITRHGL